MDNIFLRVASIIIATKYYLCMNKNIGNSELHIFFCMTYCPMNASPSNVMPINKQFFFWFSNSSKCRGWIFYKPFLFFYDSDISLFLSVHICKQLNPFYNQKNYSIIEFQNQPSHIKLFWTNQLWIPLKVDNILIHF